MKTFSPIVFSKRSAKYSYATVNFYIGCENACEYCCINRMLNKVWQDKAKLLFRNEEDALKKFKKSVNKNLTDLQKYGIFFSLTTDPLLSSTKDLTYSSANYCIENNIPFKILTKCADWGNDSFIKNYPESKKHLAHFGFSLSGMDEFEPGASKNNERILLMKELFNSGFKTWISAEPVIDINSTLKILEEASGHYYMLRLGLLTPGKYTNPMLSTKYRKEELLELYNWVCENIKDSFVYWSDNFVIKSGLKREDFPHNCTKTGDLILENK